MSRERSAAEQQIAELLQTARTSLRLSVAFLSRLDGTTQHLEVVESSVPFLFREGHQQKQETSFCQAILDSKLPAGHPRPEGLPRGDEAAERRASPGIRSYVSVPVVLSDGTLYGTFCAAGLTSDKDLAKRDKALMDVLASAAVGDHRARGARAGAAQRDRGPAGAGHRRRRPGGGAAADRRPRDRRPGGRRGAQPLPGRVGHGARRRLRAGAQRRPRRPARTARAGAGGRAPRPRRRLRRDERLAGARCSRRECGELLGRLPLHAGAARAVRARPGRGLRHPQRRARSPSGPRACGWPSTTSARASPRSGTSSSPPPTSSRSTGASSPG